MKIRLAICLAALLAVSLIVNAALFAAEGESFGQKAKTFWGKLWGYPAKLTEETAAVVTDTTKNTTKTIAKTTRDATDIVSGKLEKTGDLIVDPVKGTAMTVGKTAKGVVEAPIKAAEQPAVERAAE
ncbi:hypothetical protein ACFL3N_01840 [Candidatus Omnitrophota bacterium]